jgi:hypothetical protein
LTLRRCNPALHNQAHRERRTIRAALAAALIFLALAGCASDPRYRQGANWVAEQEAERKRLNDAGFPQYGGSM